MSTFVDYGKRITVSLFQRYVLFFFYTHRFAGEEALDGKKMLIKR
jgi:hypothetical protein